MRMAAINFLYVSAAIKLSAMKEPQEDGVSSEGHFFQTQVFTSWGHTLAVHFIRNTSTFIPLSN